MSQIISVAWGLAGMIALVAGKQFIECAACFLVCGIFLASAELNDCRKELKELKEELEVDSKDE
jgi:hypothetical protein